MMEPVTIHAKTFGTDGYGDPTETGFSATPSMSLDALVAPNHDPLQIAVGRENEPIKFNVYIPGGSPNGIDPKLHVANVRGVFYEIDAASREWEFWIGPHAGDHFTVTDSID